MDLVDIDRALAEVNEVLRLAEPLEVKPQPHQMPPPEPWKAWVLAAGRGAGKSFAAVHWLNRTCLERPGLRARIIAPTYGDGVASCVEGPDGLLARHPQAVFRPSASGGARVEYPNGSTVWIVGTATPRDVDRLRALTNVHVDVFEEAAANPQIDAAFTQAGLSRRQNWTRWVAATTPRALPIMKQWRDDPNISYLQVPSSINKHIPQEWLDSLEKMKGTRLYRQEVEGEILDDVEGALWNQSNLDRSRVDHDTALSLVKKITIGVDPPSGSGTCGIVVCGRADDGHVYVLDDYSLTDVSPHQWAMAVRQAKKDYESAMIVAEVNQGGRMVTEVLKQSDPSDPIPVLTVNASKGKQTRAEPIALLWEADEQLAHLAGENLSSLSDLEDQMTGWVPGTFSPDRVDAMVWASTHLLRGSTLAPAVRRPRGALPGI